MKLFRKKIVIPRFLQRILWSIAGAGLLFTLSSAVQLKRESVILETRIDFIDRRPMEHMLTADDILNILYENYSSDLVEVPVRHLDTKLLEARVEANDYVREAKVYVDKLDRLWLEIREREPLARIQRVEDAYYIDALGSKLEWSDNYTPRVPVVMGEVPIGNDNYNELVNLLGFLKSDSFMWDLVDQIVIDRNSEFTLIPSLGDQRIMIGDLNGLEDKIKKLKGFYGQYVEVDGWQNCKVLDLRYAGQVICRKKIGS